MKPEYEKAVDDFVEADRKYAELEERFMSGLILKELIVPDVPVERIIEEFKLVLEELKRLLEDRNSKLLTAKNAMRSAVQLGSSQWRGPDGKPTTLTYGPFTVSSFTRRSIDASTLIELAKRKGFFDEMMALKGVSKDGREYHLVRNEFVVDYDGIMQWLKLHGHTDVIEGVYDEKEGTPTVKGPKPIAFFGEKKKDD
jgi:hypothetical protein